VTLTAPAAVTRELLERYRADVFLLDRSPGRKSSLLTDLKVFLDDVRLHDWAAGLPGNATYYRGEIPRDRSRLPRFIDEFVMGQLETDQALARLPDLTTRTAVMVLIATGLRAVDCLRLTFDPASPFLARWPARQAMQRARDRIRELTDRRWLRLPVEEVVQNLNRFLRSWAGYSATGTRLSPSTRSRATRSCAWRALSPSVTTAAADTAGGLSSTSHRTAWD
jgi:integrase